MDQGQARTFSYSNLWSKDKRGSTEHPDDAANDVDHSDDKATCAEVDVDVDVDDVDVYFFLA